MFVTSYLSYRCKRMPYHYILLQSLNIIPVYRLMTSKSHILSDTLLNPLFICKMDPHFLGKHNVNEIFLLATAPYYRHQI